MGPPGPPARVLKTDVFEDAYGPDHLLPSLFPDARTRIGLDWAHSVVHHARARWPTEPIAFLVGDVRRLPVRPGSIDVIYSNSTLDHFGSAAEFRSALKELADALVPGGRLIITVDNLSIRSTGCCARPASSGGRRFPSDTRRRKPASCGRYRMWGWRSWGGGR